MNFCGKVVLITGASAGIGKAIAEYFAKLGCNIIITYCQSHILSKNVEVYIEKKFKVQVDSLKCDITKNDDVNDLYKFVKEKYKKIDILINNAALSLDSDYREKTKGEFMQVLETNVWGTFLMMQVFFKITNYIFNISSTDAFDTGSNYNFDYSCSKAAINCLTNYFSQFDLSTTYIALCPNWVDTEAVRMMNQDFLQNELKRIKQKKLIMPKSIPIMIKKCIIDKTKSGSIIRIDGDVNE